jgi:hypothetical protein
LYVSVRVIIIFGFFLRILVSVWNGFFEFEFGQTADIGSFHARAAEFSQNPSIQMCEHQPAHVFICGLGFLYFLTTDSLFQGSLFSNFSWLASALILFKTMKLLSIKKRLQKQAMLIYVLLPSSIILTSLTLREPYQLLLVNLLIYAGLKVYLKKSYMYWFLVIFAVFFMSFLHGGLLIFGFFVMNCIMILLARRRFKKGYNKIKLAFIVPVVVLISSVGISYLLEYSKGYKKLSEGLVAGVVTYQKGGISVAVGSNAAYRNQIDIKDNFDLLLFMPQALFQYLFEPMPWRILRVMDLGLLFENILRVWLIWRTLTGIRRISVTMKNPMFFLAISYFVLETIWSLGTMNWGTAVRHKIPGFGILILAAFMYSKPERKRTYSPIPTNVEIAP